MKVFYQIGTSNKEPLDITPDMSVSQLKTIISAASGVDFHLLRLVFRGKIMDDNQSIEAYGVQENDCIHAARLASNKASHEASSKVSPVSPPEDEIMKALDNPIFNSLLGNPEFMSAMLESDPRISQMAEKNPEIRSLMRDPQFLRQTMKALRNPSARKEMMRNQGYYICI
jgi:hypothetical protein